MDFHCLTRKELQFLCKKNKIPANITNVAMVDALKALELVEGLEEIQNQSPSSEKTVNKEIFGTVTRTSTRRKPSKEEHQSTQSTIRTRRTARKTTGVDEENKSLNVPEIEVKDLMFSDMLETPLPSVRRRPGVGSTRSKANAQKEGSMQRVYGTRQSVRLLEKSMAGLCIKESEKKAVKVDEIVECEDGSNNGQSGATLELPLVRNLSTSLEDEREFKVVEENNKCVNVESDETDKKLRPEDGSCNRESNEKTDELECKDKVADDRDGIIDLKGSDGNPVSEDSINLNVELVDDEGDDVAVSNDAHEIKNLNEKSEACETNHVADETNNEYEESVVDETKSIEVSVLNAEDVPVTVLSKAEEHAFGEVSQNVLVVPVEGHMDSSSAEKENEESNDDEDSKIDDDTGSDCKSIAEEYDDADGKVSQNVLAAPVESHMDSSSAEKENEESNDDDDTGPDCKSLAEEYDDAQSVPKHPAEGHMDYSSKRENDNVWSDIGVDTGVDSKSPADELQEKVSCEQKGSTPTAAYSFEDPRNMVYEESESSDDDDNTGKEESDDGDEGPRNMVYEESESSSDDDDSIGKEESDDGPRNMVYEESKSSDDDDSTGKEESDDGAEGPRNMVYEESESSDDDSTGKEESDDDDDEGPKNMVYEEFESSDDDNSTGNEESDDGDEAFLGNSNIGYAPQSDSKSLPEAEDPMTNMVNANVTEAETTPVTSLQNAPQSVMDDIAQKVVNYGGSEPVTDVCVKTTPVSNSESSNKMQTTMTKLTQVSDNLDEDNIVEKQQEMQKLEALSLRQLKKLNKMFQNLDMTEKMKNKEDK